MPRSGWPGVGFCSVGVGLTRHGCAAAALLSVGPSPGRSAAAKGWIGAASSLELAPAPLLQAGSSCLRAPEPRPQALCLGAVDAASAAAGAAGLRKAQGHTMGVAAPPSNPLRGVPVRRGTSCKELSAAVGCPKVHRRSGSGARSEGFGQMPGVRDAHQVCRCNERSTVGLNRSEIRRLLLASPAAWPPRCGERLRCR